MGLTRGEAWSRWGLIREIEPLTQAAYEFYEWLEQQKSSIGDAAEHEWHLSFHGSQFPGDNEFACARKAIYTMMDLPRAPMSRRLRGQSEAGKDIEDRIVQKYYLSGYLLSAPPPPFGKYQTVFEDREHWLTSTVDSIVVHPRQNRGRVVEIKSKSADVIEEMQRLCRGPDEKHVYQVKCQIGLAHDHGPWKVKRCYNSGRLAIFADASDPNSLRICPEHGNSKCLRDVELKPVEDGFIQYVSRDDPNETWEFYYAHDEAFMQAGRNQLKRWKEAWLSGILPQSNFSDKRFSHPFGWTWTKSNKCPESPCEWCDYGEICRSDHRAAVKLGRPIAIADSSGIELATELRPRYDIDLVRAALEKRWL